MEHTISSLKNRLLFLSTASFALTPLLGYAIAVDFGMIDPATLFSWPGGILLIATSLVLLLGQSLHFIRYLNPITRWLEQHPDQSTLPEIFNQRLNNFSDNYWGVFLIYALSVPTIQHWYGLYPENTTAYTSLLHFILLQLVIAIMTGLPGYLLSLSTLGRLAHHIGHTQVHVSMKSKMLLIGAFLPVLCTTILLRYYWWQTGFLPTEILLIWLLMSMMSFALTLLMIRGLNQ